VFVAALPLVEAITNCGGWPPSREENETLSVSVGINPKLYVPSPVTAAVTLYSVQTPVAIAPVTSNAELVIAGFVLHVLPVSIQFVSVAYTVGPLTVPDVEYTRRTALWTVPVTPLTENFIYDSYVAPTSPSTQSCTFVPLFEFTLFSRMYESALAINVSDEDAAVEVGVKVVVGVKVGSCAVHVAVGDGVSVGVKFGFAVAVTVGVKVFVGVKVGNEVLVGVKVGNEVLVGVVVGNEVLVGVVVGNEVFVGVGMAPPGWNS